MDRVFLNSQIISLHVSAVVFHEPNHGISTPGRQVLLGE
jgi:hypothetical protein